MAAFDGRPVTDIALALADEVTALHATVAGLTALHLRHRTGTGQHIDLSRLEAMLSTDDHITDAIDQNHAVAGSRGHVWEAVGGPILISAHYKTVWHRLSQHAGLRDSCPADATLETKLRTRAAPMTSWTVGFKDRQKLITELEAADLAWADVRDPTNLFDSPSLRAGQCVTLVDDHAGDVRGVIRTPYRFSDAESDVRGPAPQRGEHNREVLAHWLGASDADLDALIASGVLQQCEL